MDEEEVVSVEATIDTGDGEAVVTITGPAAAVQAVVEAGMGDETVVDAELVDDGTDEEEAEA